VLVVSLGYNIDPSALLSLSHLSFLHLGVKGGV